MASRLFATTLVFAVRPRVIVAYLGLWWIVEVEQQRIDELSDTLDCGFVAGDATRPEVLEEVGPDGDDVLISLSDGDPSNLVAAACGRRLGFGRAIVKLDDRALELICHALELDEVLVLPEAVA